MAALVEETPSGLSGCVKRCKNGMDVLPHLGILLRPSQLNVRRLFGVKGRVPKQGTHPRAPRLAAADYVSNSSSLALVHPFKKSSFNVTH